jgi:hypothetical protein
MNQKENLKKLMSLLQKYKDNKAIAETIEILTPLSKIYENIDAGSITKKQMKQIAAAVKIAREKIIK